MRLKDAILNPLRGAKNLLAFSHGSDSSALFFILLENKIDFDLAFINYKVRKQSDEEQEGAKDLARIYKKEIFIKIAARIEGNFQAQARMIRYDFFEELCKKYHYENVILAHNLNDKFEWFLMQLSKGAGIFELLGFKMLEKRQHYTIVRPLMEFSKDEILSYLKAHNIAYFHDRSNEDKKYFRNQIRLHYANSFVFEFKNGINRSFKYLENDLALLESKLGEYEGIYAVKKNESQIAQIVKKLGIVMSSLQRKQCLEKDCVISGKIAIVYKDERALIFPYERTLKIPKQFKELYRKAKIPPLLRAYMFNHNIKDVSRIKELLGY